MSVFKRGIKITKGALGDESDTDSEEEEEDEIRREMKAQKKRKSKGADEDEDEDDDDEEEQEDEEEEESEGEIDLGWKYEPDEVVVEEDDAKKAASGEITFPLSCAVCQGKTLFNNEQVEAHMKSKKHLKNEKKHELDSKKSTRTPEQIAKLKARNQRKKDKKMERKKSEQPNQGHVWGEHKKPEKRKETPQSKTPESANKKQRVSFGKNSSKAHDEDDALLESFGRTAGSSGKKKGGKAFYTASQKKLIKKGVDVS